MGDMVVGMEGHSLAHFEDLLCTFLRK